MTEEQYQDKVRFADNIRTQLNEKNGRDMCPGAEPCPRCEILPVGMVKTPSYIKDGVELPTLYEVGCVVCPPYLIEAEGGVEVKLDGKAATVKRRSFSARAYGSPEAAVEKWNAGDFVEDTHIDRNMPKSELARIGK
ncbi:MAG: hypothetical protein ACK4S4_15920 [Pyrinomonadaceae bacterium]